MTEKPAPIPVSPDDGNYAKECGRCKHTIRLVRLVG